MAGMGNSSIPMDVRAALIQKLLSAVPGARERNIPAHGNVLLRRGLGALGLNANTMNPAAFQALARALGLRGRGLPDMNGSRAMGNWGSQPSPGYLQQYWSQNQNPNMAQNPVATSAGYGGGGAPMTAPQPMMQDAGPVTGAGFDPANPHPMYSVGGGYMAPQGAAPQGAGLSKMGQYNGPGMPQQELIRRMLQSGMMSRYR